jgi:hypothetical protein
MTCIFREIFNCPCPTCGVTRALISLLKGDLQDYFHYNLMAVPLCIATVLMIIGTKVKIKKLQIISIVILLINIPYYFYRLRLGVIP